MLRMTARRHWGIQVNASTDTVYLGITLPSGSMVHSVRGHVSYVNGTLAGDPNLYKMTQALYAASEGYVLPIQDPDAASSLDSLWDRFVPKDTDIESMDLDTAAVDATPFFEPGEMAMARIFKVGVQPQQVFAYQRQLTAMRDALWIGQPIVSPLDEPLWIAGASFELSIGRPIFVSQPSVLVFAFGAPDLDDTSTTPPTALAEKELPQLKYFEDILVKALLDQLNVPVAGEPWDQASALLRKHLNPDVYEGVANAFPSAFEWSVFGQASIDHSVVGQMKLGNVSTGR